MSPRGAEMGSPEGGDDPVVKRMPIAIGLGHFSIEQGKFGRSFGIGERYRALGGRFVEVTRRALVRRDSMIDENRGGNDA